MPEQAIDESLRAVADPTRRAILRLVRDGELPAGEIATPLPVHQPPGGVPAPAGAGRRGARRGAARRQPPPLPVAARGAARRGRFVEEMWADRLARLKAAAERRGVAGPHPRRPAITRKEPDR